jgi:signal peptidase II
MVKKKAYLFWHIALAAVLIDQLTKWVASSAMSVGEVIQIIPKFLFLTHVENRGAGFGILQGQNTFLILVSLVAIIAIVLYSKKIMEEHHTTLFAALILGGAVGNLIDRLLYGHVTDFIYFTFWPAFNIADTALTVGVLGLIWLSFRESK